MGGNCRWEETIVRCAEPAPGKAAGFAGKIVSALQADDRFVAAWLTGSLGRGGGDSFSDIDLTVVVRESDAEIFCARPWMVAGRTTPERFELFERFGEPAIVHENNHNAAGDGTFTCIVYAEEAMTVDWSCVPERNAALPDSVLVLFDKASNRSTAKKPVLSLEERGQAASLKVAFFWMMTTVAIKYMLRRDTVFLHVLLHTLERTLLEVSGLVEGRATTHHSGSAVKLASTQHQQIALIREFAAQMLDMMPQAVELGGYVPEKPMQVIDQLLALSLDDEAVSEAAIKAVSLADKDKAKTIIHLLENYIGKRPGMYIGGTEPESCIHFLNGFNGGLGILGLTQDTGSPTSTYETVIQERGWQHTAHHYPHRQMIERGMDSDAIIQELIAIEIETWKRSYGIGQAPGTHSNEGPDASANSAVL